MHIRILSEHPAVEGKCSDVVEVDGADPTIKSLIAMGLIEPAEPAPTIDPPAEPPPAIDPPADAVPPAEPAPPIDPPALPPQPAGKK